MRSPSSTGLVLWRVQCEIGASDPFVPFVSIARPERSHNRSEANLGPCRTTTQLPVMAATTKAANSAAVIAPAVALATSRSSSIWGRCSPKPIHAGP